MPAICLNEKLGDEMEDIIPEEEEGDVVFRTKE
jgi:hypothetical protein